MKKKYKNCFFNKYFPNKFEINLFIKKSFFVLLASFCLSLNSFVDSFMVSHIPGGLQAVGYVNIFTNILYSLLIAISIISSVMIAQYFGAQKYHLIFDVMKIRIILSFLVTILFSLFFWIWSEELLKLVSLQKTIVKDGKTYLLLISVYWLILSWVFHMVRLLSEIGKIIFATKVSFFLLATNIFLNFFNIHILGLGLIGAGIATILSAFIMLIILLYYFHTRIPYLKITRNNCLKINWHILKKFRNQIIALIAQAIASNLIIFRIFFWNYALQKVGPSGHLNIMHFLGIIGSISTLLTSNLYVIDNNINYFVGRSLGKRDIILAKKQADKILGFNTLLTFLLSLFVFLVMVCFLYSGFLTKGIEREMNTAISPVDSNVVKLSSMLWQELENIMDYYRITFVQLLAIHCFINPFYALSITEIKIMRSGGKINKISIIHASLMLLQIVWIAFISFFLIEHFPWLKENFYVAFIIFFFSEILKSFLYFKMRKKINWAHNITEDNKFNEGVI